MINLLRKYKIINFFLLIIILLILFFLLFFSTFFFLNYFIINKNLYVFFTIRLVFIIAFIFLLNFLLYKKVIKTRINARYKNISLSIFTFIIFLLILEGVFMFIPISHSAGYTLASVNWHYYYWNPINKFGYRDKEHNLQEIKDKKKIFVLGDSFTAGDGIKKVKNRYSNVLKSLLPEDYEVINLGLRDSDTKYEYYRLTNFPVKPDILILQYYMNDFEGAAVSNGKQFSVTPYNSLLKKIILNSYFINYIYWRFPQKEISYQYNEFLISSFENEKIINEHLRDLYLFIKVSKSYNIDLVVVLFPNLSRIEFSNQYLTMVEQLFNNNNIPLSYH